MNFLVLMMTAETLLSRLDGIKATGQGRWIARCPAHADKRPSLSLRELDDGRTLLHCFAGCDAESILNAVGLDYSALFPDKPKGGLYVRNERRPFNALDIMQCLHFEATIVYVTCRDILEGKPLMEVDRERLLVACQRLGAGVEVADGR